MSIEDQPPAYPPGSVRSLLATDLVTPRTRQALASRLSPPLASPRFFTEREMATLRAACDRLLALAEPRDGAYAAIDPAADLGARLAAGTGDGWRFHDMPPDGEAHRRGLHGLDQSAGAMFGRPFTELAATQQDDVLRAVQRGDAPGATWQGLPARRYFEDLLAEVAQLYYSHPLAQEEIGYAGMADAHGWHAIGLNRLDPWEPRPLGDGQPSPSPSHPSYPSGRTPPLLPQAGEGVGGEGSPPMRRYMPEDEVDAVVIGAGAGGAPLLARLAAAGLRVVALEAGQYWQPQRDFATDERAQEFLFWRDERLSAGADPLPFGKNNSGIGVGGSTLHYTAYVPRPHPDDFRLRSHFGVGMDWPLGYDDLAPYCDEVERILGVSGPGEYPWGPPRPPYPLPPLPLNGAAQLMRKGCDALGLRAVAAPNAALAAPYYQPGIGWRGACTNRGFCQAGCSVGAKGSTDVTFIPLAIGAGAEVRTGCFATGFERDRRGRITAVVYRQDGTERRQACRAVFLCAGAIETPRFLLIHGLANSSGQVGRNFMAHMALQLWGRVEDDVRPFKGIPGGLISEDMHRPRDADFAGGYLLQSIGMMPLDYVEGVARARGLFGAELRRHMRDYNHAAGLNIHGECLPHAHNRLELSDERDDRGLPKPVIWFSHGENERRLLAHGERMMRRIWEAAGVGDVWTSPRGAHTAGTCRMGADPAQAVVDVDGRSFDVPNLYVMDNSVFPSSLSVNPALTIMALSLRVADRFLARAQHGDSMFTTEARRQGGNTEM